ncbi:MAG: methyltransferase [Candidatus Symbiobacter sp.]|nr:methyltransferase [Candidatus Symbiobacter sp.]
MTPKPPTEFPPDYTDQTILGGRIMLRQMRLGYRVAEDSVYLAAAVTAPAGERILELGSGVGAVSLCLAHRLATVLVTGYEIAPALVALANHNAAVNGLAARVRFFARDIGDVSGSGAGTGTGTGSGTDCEKFDQIIMNPPFHGAHHSQSRDPARQTAFYLHDLRLWLTAAGRHLRPGGRVTLIFRADGLAELLIGLAPQFGSFRILPLTARADQPAKRILICAQLGGKAPLVLGQPLVTHQIGSHSHSAAAEKILRDGADLPL